jgi:hypothetical protein
MDIRITVMQPRDLHTFYITLQARDRAVACLESRDRAVTCFESRDRAVTCLESRDVRDRPRIT